MSQQSTLHIKNNPIESSKILKRNKYVRFKPANDSSCMIILY